MKNTIMTTKDKVIDFDMMNSYPKNDILHLRCTNPQREFLKALSSKYNVTVSQLVLDTLMLAWKEEYNGLMMTTK